MTHSTVPGDGRASPTAALRPGLASGCGSLPHRDAAAAVELLLATTPACPSVPALPNRHPGEGMLGQAAAGLRGMRVAPDGSLVVDDVDGLDPEDPGAADSLPDDAFGAMHAFLAAVAGPGPAAIGIEVLKLQVTGPVTFGSALVAAGVAPRVAFPLASTACRRRARALLAAVRSQLGEDLPVLVVVDEPSLGAATTGRAAVGAEEAVDLLSGTLAAVEAHAVAGVHCCAPADWAAVLRAGPALLSFPLEVAHTVRAAELGPFLEEGGWVAWGAVPTDGPLGPLDGGGARRLWRHLAERWHLLADGGVDPVLLRQRALVTPACGLARHDVTQAALALGLTAALGDRIAAGTFAAGERALS